MSLTDPNDEKEAIEAEHMLSAERDARCHMREFVIELSFQENQWRASLINCESKSSMGTFKGNRDACVKYAFDLWDEEHARISLEIYDREYKLNK